MCRIKNRDNPKLGCQYCDHRIMNVTSFEASSDRHRMEKQNNMSCHIIRRRNETDGHHSPNRTGRRKTHIHKKKKKKKKNTFDNWKHEQQQHHHVSAGHLSLL